MDASADASKETATAIAYIRVSTEKQENGPEAQRHAIETFAAARGIEIIAWYEDRCSGATPADERDGLMDALLALRGCDYFLAHKRDRIARDVAVAATIEKAVQGAGAVTLTVDGPEFSKTPEGELMRGILDVFAQYERAMISLRTRLGVRAAKARGSKFGQKRFRSTERGVEAHAFALGLQQAGRSYREIAGLLDRMGYMTAQKRRFTPRSVRKLLAAADAKL